MFQGDPQNTLQYYTVNQNSLCVIFPDLKSTEEVLNYIELPLCKIRDLTSFASASPICEIQHIPASTEQHSCLTGLFLEAGTQIRRVFYIS